jgi:transcriptional regulator with XRE-family HTH domain
LTLANRFVTLRYMTGKEVQRLRKRLGLTQAELAQRMGVSRVSVARWETDEHAIRESAARLLLTMVEQEERRVR